MLDDYLRVARVQHSVLCIPLGLASAGGALWLLSLLQGVPFWGNLWILLILFPLAYFALFGPSAAVAATLLYNRQYRLYRRQQRIWTITER